ncbi:hypothetical protein PR048_010315 [Dryococelus australis]|uniref:Uncharacterized protein n=1 Tax=Dryococelus australis TaxID=614101 RepID=A0ABQ9I2F0_9NEOP|nr:hypothetical protein PR048_010315 [Dryococelus australis]
MYPIGSATGWLLRYQALIGERKSDMLLTTQHPTDTEICKGCGTECSIPCTLPVDGLWVDYCQRPERHGMDARLALHFLLNLSCFNMNVVLQMQAPIRHVFCTVLNDRPHSSLRCGALPYPISHSVPHAPSTHSGPAYSRPGSLFSCRLGPLRLASLPDVIPFPADTGSQGINFLLPAGHKSLLMACVRFSRLPVKMEGQTGKLLRTPVCKSPQFLWLPFPNITEKGIHLLPIFSTGSAVFVWGNLAVKSRRNLFTLSSLNEFRCRRSDERMPRENKKWEFTLRKIFVLNTGTIRSYDNSFDSGVERFWADLNIQVLRAHEVEARRLALGVATEKKLTRANWLDVSFDDSVIDLLQAARVNLKILTDDFRHIAGFVLLVRIKQCNAVLGEILTDIELFVACSRICAVGFVLLVRIKQCNAVLGEILAYFEVAFEYMNLAAVEGMELGRSVPSLSHTQRCGPTDWCLFEGEGGGEVARRGFALPALSDSELTMFSGGESLVSRNVRAARPMSAHNTLGTLGGLVPAKMEQEPFQRTWLL